MERGLSGRGSLGPQGTPDPGTAHSAVSGQENQRRVTSLGWLCCPHQRLHKILTLILQGWPWEGILHPGGLPWMGAGLPVHQSLVSQALPVRGALWANPGLRPSLGSAQLSGDRAGCLARCDRGPGKHQRDKDKITDNCHRRGCSRSPQGRRPPGSAPFCAVATAPGHPAPLFLTSGSRPHGGAHREGSKSAQGWALLSKVLPVPASSSSCLIDIGNVHSRGRLCPASGALEPPLRLA